MTFAGPPRFAEMQLVALKPPSGQDDSDDELLALRRIAKPTAVVKEGAEGGGDGTGKGGGEQGSGEGGAELSNGAEDNGGEDTKGSGEGGAEASNAGGRSSKKRGSASTVAARAASVDNARRVRPRAQAAAKAEGRKADGVAADPTADLPGAEQVASQGGGGAHDKTDAELLQTLQAPSFVETPVCSRCMTVAEPDRFAVSTKSSGSWKSKTCNTRATQVSRVPGWKEFMAKFKGFNADEKVEVWQSVASSGDKAFLTSTMTSAMSKRTVHTKTAKRAGNYLPLGWYAKQGFDEILIKGR